MSTGSDRTVHMDPKDAPGERPHRSGRRRSSIDRDVGCTEGESRIHRGLGHVDGPLQGSGTRSIQQIRICRAKSCRPRAWEMESIAVRSMIGPA
eukprot:scaffold270_cov347-Pavlova_lutheri.AAC.17